MTQQQQMNGQTARTADQRRRILPLRRHVTAGQHPNLTSMSQVMTQEGTSTAPQPPFRLLQLPGEFRNRIYQHIAQSTAAPTSLSTIIRMTPPPYSLPHFRRSPAHAFFWSEFRRQSLGLTQVCRLLREEFLPLHHSSVAIEVWPTHLDRYMWDFFSNGEARGIIYLPIYDAGVVNILPLLRLRARSPHLDLRFDCEEVEDWAMLRNLVDVERWKTWTEYALRFAAQVQYHVPSGMLVIKVCEHVRENWMLIEVSFVDEPGRNYHDAKLDWCRRVGLQNYVEVDQVRVSG